MEQRFPVRLGFSVACAVLGACAGEDESSDAMSGAGADPDAGGSNVRDVRIEPPALEPGVINFAASDAIIQRGEERMFCFHMQNDGPDEFVREVEILQGPFGHHAVILSTKEPEPVGTVEDCSDRSQMWKYSALLIPMDLPESYAQRLPAGQHMVLQSHYINAGEVPILVRDVIRLHTVSEAEVETDVATFITHNQEFELPVGEPHEQSFDCTFDQDAELLLIAGHMHEHGTSFELHHGPSPESVERLYEVPDWLPDYRDSPPVERFLDAPRALRAGDTLRTVCRWTNTEDHMLVFPEEMCVALGLIAGTREHYECRIGGEDPAP